MRFRITIDINRRPPAAAADTRDVDMAGAGLDLAEAAPIGFTIPNPSTYAPPEENR